MTMDMIEQVKFESTLTEGMRVWARWTNNNSYYHVAATVLKVNASSVRVSIDKDIPLRSFSRETKEFVTVGVIYPKGKEIVLNLSTTKQGKVNKKWSPNSGCFALDLFNERGRMLRKVRCPKCTQDMTLVAEEFKSSGGFAQCTNRFCGKRFEVAPQARSGHHMVRCPGEAHSNGFIDHCGLCMPRWGWLELPAKYDSLDEYRDACAFENNPGVVHYELFVKMEPPHYAMVFNCGSKERTTNLTKFEKLVTCEHCKAKLAEERTKKETA